MDERHLTYFDFASHIGVYLGYDRGEANGGRAWTDKQARTIRENVASGQRMFYYPEVLPGESVAHSWSFLTPTSELRLAQGASSVKLPLGCGSQVEGPIVYTASGLHSRFQLRQTNWPDIRHLNANFPDREGPPAHVAIEPLPHSGTSAGGPQRWQLHVHPKADADYTLFVTYQVVPEMLSADRPYHYGGAQHTETVLAACIAAAELFRDDRRGPRYDYFMQRLIASVHLDRRARPQVLGYNGDASDARWRNDPNNADRRYWSGPLVTVHGLTPE